jgi:UDPglucose 6-dehydrogenase
MKILVVGLGYVGLSNAVILAKNNSVTAIDINQKTINLLQQGKIPISDKNLEHFLKTETLDIKFEMASLNSYYDNDYVIIATPTDYDTNKDSFDTNSIEEVVARVTLLSPKSIIVIRSTIPIGFIDNLKLQNNNQNIMFCPEFLREGSALNDSLFPSRIIVGERSKRAELFAELLQKATVNQSADILLTGSKEAESIKLFSNTYLAMRVAYFNELDSFALSENLITEEIINGVSLDTRIGQQYNNPSFGYGGYCLPKDTKQLLANYGKIPQNIISAIVESNKTRKKFIYTKIIEKNPKIVGIYRLVMKTESDNFRGSAVNDLIEALYKSGIKLIIFEPTVENIDTDNYTLVNDQEMFKQQADLIIANRFSENLLDVKDKVFTRDIFFSD